jgi:diacylglycerol kinase family enzyme
VKRAGFVVNPIKCTDLEAIKDAARSTPGWAEPLYYETTVDDAGAAATKQALTAGVDVVVICGGDGTVTACLGVLVGTGTPAAIVGCGTGNLLARNLEIPLGLAAALQVAFGGVDRPIDLGMLDGEWFAVMAGVGVDAAMLADTDDALKARVGWPAYAVSALRHLRDTPIRVELRPADGPAVSRRASSVLIGNVGRLQANLPLLPDAEPDDGVLDVLVMAPRGLIGWLRLAAAVAVRRRQSPTFERLRVRAVDIVAQRSVACERDGEVVASRRVIHVEIAPNAVLVRRPASVA